MPYLHLDLPSSYPVEVKRELATRLCKLYAEVMETQLWRPNVGIAELGSHNLITSVRGCCANPCRAGRETKHRLRRLCLRTGRRRRGTGRPDSVRAERTRRGPPCDMLSCVPPRSRWHLWPASALPPPSSLLRPTRSRSRSRRRRSRLHPARWARKSRARMPLAPPRRRTPYSSTAPWRF